MEDGKETNGKESNEEGGLQVNEWYVTSKHVTGWVKERGGVVIDSAPIFRKFIGTPFMRLVMYYKADGLSLLSSHFETS